MADTPYNLVRRFVTVRADDADTSNPFQTFQIRPINKESVPETPYDAPNDSAEEFEVVDRRDPPKTRNPFE